jgi:hypothetical protein
LVSRPARCQLAPDDFTALNARGSGQARPPAFALGTLNQKNHMRSRTTKLPTSAHPPAAARVARRRAAPLGGLLAAAVLVLAPATSRALPSFARQMNMQCIMCHTAFPELNSFGRQFKLSGYTMSADQSQFPPIAIMLQPSFTHTQADQVGGAAPGFGANNNWAVTQLSIFYAGRLFGPYASDLFGKDTADFLNKFGIFSQTTYDGVGKAWSWDQTELRYADTGTIAGQDALWGVYANNNPTMQDPWNSTPAWGFPFSGSGLAPGPTAATMIDGGLAGQVAGVGAYLWMNGTYYVDVGAYHTLGAHLQKSLGVDPTGEMQIAGAAPYWRLAVEEMVGDARWEFGTFGMGAAVYPGRDSSAGKDRILDLGVDTQYQISSGPHDFTGMLSFVHEKANWDASSVLGNTANAGDKLWTAKATATYLYDKTYGFDAQYFLIDGTNDTGLIADSPTGSPTSDGFVFQLDYLPFNKGTGPSFWPRSNVRLSLQYTVYNRFDGARNNYDGAGTNASANNTLYAEAWIAF